MENPWTKQIDEDEAEQDACDRALEQASYNGQVVEILQLGRRRSVVAFDDHSSMAVWNSELLYVTRPYRSFLTISLGV